MRIVTRPDFDGIVCAVLIHEAETIDSPTLWVEPGEVQKGEADIREGDIMANLPYDPRCSVWFDHHFSNQPEGYDKEGYDEDLYDVKGLKIEGAFDIAPSAAGVVYKYYKRAGRLAKDFDELIHWTDIIDAADLNEDQVLRPEAYPYIQLSMAVKNRDNTDPPFWERLVGLLRNQTITEVMADKEVTARCDAVVKENRLYVDILKQYTVIHGRTVSVADFRSMEKVPSGNRFLTYSLFPETNVSVKIRYADHDRDLVLLSIGRSIFNPRCRVNVGKLLANYGGGGHAGAGGCSLAAKDVDWVIDEILPILEANQEN
ncbi:MAG: exopolyphosphatase [Desulfobacterium sp.]|jgi:oligoribonuclease NrnB/cAMP/cGMP phosphodiesterase (DHH superfamily)|nr:exopolyphosphatase [Desulfobacterium sp.]